ncbi:uncharacterized protein [Watersipora subatra]|uniref:uncharacterized protein isoform X2 n=1 Tax=Watersipora subatra TaxID=2589382 RepID=UPI00355B83B7
MKEKSPVESSDRMEEGGFVSAVDQVLTYLNEKREELDTGKFEQLVGAAVRHCLSVISLSPDSLKSCSTRNSCMMVLPMVAGIVPMCKNARHPSELQQMREDFERECKDLITEVHDLERKANSALIEIIVDTFKETREPLDRLVTAVHSTHKNQKLRDVTDDAQPFIDDMSEHSARMFEVARLVADSTSNAQMVTRIKSSLSILEGLNSQLLPSIITSYSQTNHAREKWIQANHVLERWTQELTALSSAIDEITDSAVFAQVSAELVIRNGSRLKWMLTEGAIDIHEYADLVRAQLGLATHLVYIMSHHNHTHASERLNLAVSKLKGVTSDVSQSAASLTLDKDDSNLREALLDNNCLLEHCMIFIKSILNEESTDDSFLLEFKEAADQYLDKRKQSDRIKNEKPSDEEERSENEGISDGAQRWLSLETSSFHIGSSTRLNSYEQIKLTMSMHRDEPDIGLSQLVQHLLACALSFDVVATECCCNELMERANDIISIANCITPHVTNSDEKSEIKSLVSSLCSETVELSVQIRQLAEANMANLDALKSLLASWSRNVERLENGCDNQISSILQLASPICVAVEMNNQMLTQSAKKNFLLSSDELSSILSCDSDAQPELTILITYWLANANLKNNICALLNGPCRLSKLMTRCREWACNALLATRTIAAESEHQLLIQCNMTSHTYSDCLSLMEHSIKYIYGALSMRAGEEMDTCKELIANMAHLLEITPDQFQPTEEIFADLKTSVLLLRWSEKAARFFRLVDKLLEPHCEALNKLAETAIQAFSSDGNSKDDMLRNYKQLRDSLQESVTTLCTQHASSEDELSSYSELLRKIPDRLETVIVLTERLTLESATEELLAAYNTEKRLLIINLLDLRQHVSTIQNASDQSEFNKILGVSRSKGNEAGSCHTFAVTPSKESAISNLQQTDMATGLGQMPTQSDMKASKHSDSQFIRAVKAFRGELVRWADKNNAVVRAARDLAINLQDMSLYVKYQEGSIISRRQLFDTSKQVVSNSYTIKKFCEVIAKYSLAGQRFTDELLYYSNQATFYAEQLSMLTNVKRSTSPFDVTIKALATTGDNLLKSILKSLEASESILLKGLKEPPLSAKEEQEIYVLAIKWRSQLEKHRHTEINYSDVNDLGLRVISKIDDGPHLAEICQPCP